MADFDPATVPAEARARIQKHWTTLEPQIQDRLTRAGLAPEADTGDELIGPPLRVAAPPSTAGQPASLGAVRASLQTPEARAAGRSITRKAAEVAGAGVGGALGLAGGGPLGMGLGAVQGGGAAASVMDLLEGQGDWRRMALQAGATALPEVASFGKALTLGRRVIASGLLSGIAGQAYDVATGEGPATLGGTALQAAEDVGAGALGAELGQANREVFVPGRRHRASVLPKSEQEFRQTFAREEDIPLSASGVTGSRGIAKVEQIPTRVPLGADRAAAFYDRQLAATEASMTQRLQKIDALTERATPTVIGEAVRDEMPKLADELSKSADQAFTAVKGYFRQGEPTEVLPENWVAEAEAIFRESQRAPYPAPGQPGRIIQRHEQAPAFVSPPPQPMMLPVLYAPNGQPITLQQIAGDPRPMSYDQARFYLKQMAARTFRNGQPVVGDIDDGIRQRLWAGLNDDITTMLDRHPEAHEMYRWAKRGYGLTKEAINDRLQPLAERGEVEMVAGKLFPPGVLKRTLEMKQLLPREVFDQATAGLVRGWYDQARTRATTGGREAFSSAKMTRVIEPYARSGQLEVMFDPDTATFFRRFVRFEPALQSTERLAGNPSGTGQALASFGQAGLLAQPLLHPTEPAAYEAAAAAGLPWLLAQGMFSPPGSALLAKIANEGLGPVLARGTVGSYPAALAAGQGIGREVRRGIGP